MLFILTTAPSLVAELPFVSYVFPAGGRQGTTVDFKVGGHYLHGEASFEMLGPGVEASRSVREVDTVWFEGPLIPMPASQQKEDYPRDHAGQVTIAPDAPVGVRHWRVWTSQGATPAAKFVIGNLPEAVEQETDGSPLPTHVSLPVTVNGRIFPREDIDIWTLSARAGEIVSCSVNAQRLGSALNARIEIRDPSGNRLAEAVAVAGEDPSLQWNAPADGLYEVRIHDIDFGGLQHYVYRLTLARNPHIDTTFPLGGKRGSSTRIELIGHDGAIRGEVELGIPDDAPDTCPLAEGAFPRQANSVLLQTGDAPEWIEEEPNDSSQQAPSTAVSVPCVLNGRIQNPGDVDFWSVAAAMGQVIECRLLAGDLGSPLFPVMTAYDPSGKEIARSGNPDDPKIGATLSIEAPSAGTYHIAVSEHFTRRGGAHFGYRLSLRPPSAPDFKLTLSTDAITVFREVEGLSEEEIAERPPAPPAKLAVEVQRIGGFTGEIELNVEGLPEGVHVENNIIAGDKQSTELTFRAEPGATIAATHLTILGKAVVGDDDNSVEVVRSAGATVARGEPPLDQVLLAVAMPTPFKFSGDYNSFPLPRGSIYRRHYRLSRGGFTGPLYARLADRQVRHLQGNRGPTLIIPPGATEFDYGVFLAPRLEIGRTSRTTIMIYGTAVDRDGSEHVLSFTSGEQNHQFIGQMVAGLLSIRPLQPALAAEPGSTVALPVMIGRHPSVENAVIEIGLQIPDHFKGCHADPVTVPAGHTTGTLEIHFTETSGSFNMPAKVTATTLGLANPHVAEAPLEFVEASPARAAANPKDPQAGGGRLETAVRK